MACIVEIDTLVCEVIGRFTDATGSNPDYLGLSRFSSVVARHRALPCLIRLDLDQHLRALVGQRPPECLGNRRNHALLRLVDSDLLPHKTSLAAFRDHINAGGLRACRPQPALHQEIVALNAFSVILILQHQHLVRLERSRLCANE
jgi:hypothetical protein